MTSDFAAGNYRFIPAVFQYSGGAAALPGYEVERVRFDKMPPLAQGFARIADYIKAAGRPLTSFCACELRSPAAFTDQGFLDFNQHYVKTLAEWGIYDGKTNPVARSNVCPEIDPPAEPSFYAFSFVRPSTNATPSFVIAGSGEAQEGAGPYSERTVRYRDLSPGRHQRQGPPCRRRHGEAAWARSASAGRTRPPRRSIPSATIITSSRDELVKRGAARSGLTWHFARPPVIDLEYEMDCRRVTREIVI